MMLGQAAAARLIVRAMVQRGLIVVDRVADRIDLEAFAGEYEWPELIGSLRELASHRATYLEGYGGEALAPPDWNVNMVVAAWGGSDGIELDSEEVRRHNRAASTLIGSIQSTEGTSEGVLNPEALRAYSVGLVVSAVKHRLEGGNANTRDADIGTHFRGWRDTTLRGDELE